MRANVRLGNRRTLAGVVALISVGGLLSGCGGGSNAATDKSLGFKLVNPGYLTVAYTDGDLPEIASGPNNTLVGTDGKLMEALAKHFGLKLKPEQMAFPSQILAVKNGRADIGTTTYYTTDRAKEVYYGFPFWRDTAGVYVAKNSNYTGVDSLKGKTVSTIEGYVWAPYLQKAFGSSNVKLFTNISDAYTAVANGQVDAFINASGGALAPGFKKYANTMKFVPFQSGDLNMPESVMHDQAYNYVNCNNKSLAKSIDAAFLQIQKSGQWKQILQEYKIAPTSANIPKMVQPKEMCD